MPYIKGEDRRKIIDVTKDSAWELAHPRDDGELNYIITRICSDYLKRFGVSYHALKNIKGVLADVRDEMHDRLMRPYEDRKCHDNGEVFDKEVLDAINK